MDNPNRAGPGLPSDARFGYAVSTGGQFAACVERAQGEKPWTVRVWDLAGNRSAAFEVRLFKVTTYYYGGVGLLLSADGKRVALSRFNPRARGAGAFGQFDPGDPPEPSDLPVWEWDPATGAKKEVFHREFPPADANRGVVGIREFSKDGTAVVLSRHDPVETLPDGRNRVRTTLWTVNVDTGREGPSITFDGGLVASDGRLSPDGTRFAGFVRTPAADGSWNDQFTVWDLVRGSQVFAVPPGRIYWGIFRGDPNFASGTGAALWSPDGSRVAILNEPSALGSIAIGSMPLLDAATGKLIRTLNTSTRGAIAPINPRIAFSPDGRRIACEIMQRSGGGALSVLDTESGKEVLSLPLPFGSGDRSRYTRGEVNPARLTFSPDGHRLLLFRQVDTAAEIDGKRVPATALRVHTWDATPLPEPKQP